MQNLLKVSENTQLSWRNLSIQKRISFLPQLAKLLLENKVNTKNTPHPPPTFVLILREKI